MKRFIKTVKNNGDLTIIYFIVLTILFVSSYYTGNENVIHVVDAGLLSIFLLIVAPVVILWFIIITGVMLYQPNDS